MGNCCENSAADHFTIDMAPNKGSFVGSAMTVSTYISHSRNNSRSIKHASEQEVARLAEEVHALRSSLRSAVWVAPELELAPPPPPPPRRHRPAPKDDANDGAHRREDPGTPATSETDLLGWLFGLDPQWAEAGEYTCFAR